MKEAALNPAFRVGNAPQGGKENVGVKRPAVRRFLLCGTGFQPVGKLHALDRAARLCGTGFQPVIPFL